jgi:UDP-N-acetylglucosamine--N-acetylmuramyl-(pentapeptide) pyrophosphoryl-undecaprenol N-acetylglucosamine transferase
VDSPRIIISGGGTGGHIYPAIAIANAIKEITPKAEILFVGAKGRMEMEKVPEAGYAIEGLDIAGLQRKLTLKNLSFPFKVLKSLAQASAIVKNFKPNAVVGVGGYASGPLVFSAARRGVPAVLQEQNSYAGLTNKILSKYVQKICVAYPHMQQYFPASKIQFTGNPVRQDISKLENKRTEALTHFSFSPDKPVLLILGGSLGARTLNESLLADWRKLEDNGVQVIWQCGKFYYEDLKAKLTDQLSASIKLVPFIK